MLDQVCDHLELARKGHDVLINTVVALRLLFVATAKIGHDCARPNHVYDAAAAFRDTSPYVVDAAPDLAEDHVHLGMAAASGLVEFLGMQDDDRHANPADPILIDRADHALLLGAQLETVHRRKRIASRGGVFCRFVAARRALYAESAGAALH